MQRCRAKRGEENQLLLLLLLHYYLATCHQQQGQKGEWMWKRNEPPFSLCLSVYFFSFLSREDEARETTDVSDSSSGSGNGNSSSSSSFSLWFLHLAHLNSQCLPRAAIKDIHACTELALFLFTDDAMNNVASLTLYLLNQSETVRLWEWERERVLSSIPFARRPAKENVGYIVCACVISSHDFAPMRSANERNWGQHRKGNRRANKRQEAKETQPCLWRLNSSYCNIVRQRSSSYLFLSSSRTTMS